MQLSEIVRHHRNRKFRRASWPEEVSWRIISSHIGAGDYGFYTTLGIPQPANVTPEDVIAEDWEYCPS